MWAYAIEVGEKITIFILLGYIIFNWLIPFLITQLIMYKYNLSISIGRITLPYIALKAVLIKTNYFWILIDKLYFRSSLFNKHAPKLLTVNIPTLKLYFNHNSSSSNSTTSIKLNENISERRKLKAPDFISNLVQFLGFYIAETIIWGWEDVDNSKAVHFNSTILDISVDGCTTVGEATIAACIVMKSKKVKFQITQNRLPSELERSEPFISHLFNLPSNAKLNRLDSTFDFRLNAIFSPRNSGEFMDNFGIDIENLFIALDDKDSLIHSVNKLREKRNNSTKVLRKLNTPGSHLSFVQKLESLIYAQYIPKVVKLRIFETQCEISDELNTDFVSNISGFSFTSKCIVSYFKGVDMVSIESQLDLGLIRIEPDRHQAFSIDQFSNYFKLANHNMTIDLDISNLAFKSYEKSLIFDKSRFKSNLVLVQQFPKNPFQIIDVIQSIERITFESSMFQAHYYDKSGSFSTVFLEICCEDLTDIWSENNSSIEFSIKDLFTMMGTNGQFNPLCFKFLSFQLKKECFGAELKGSQFQLVPQLEKIISLILPSANSQSTTVKEDANKDIFGFLKTINIEVYDSKLLYAAENKLCINADLGKLIAQSSRRESRKTLKIERFEVFSSSDFSDCTLNPIFQISKFDYCSLNISTNSKHSSVHEVVFHNNSAMCWSPLLHKQITQFNEAIHSLISRFKSPNTEKSNEKSISLSINLRKTFTITGKLAENHAFQITSDDCKIVKNSDSFEWTMRSFNLFFDGIQIGRIDRYILSKGIKSYGLTNNYRKLANLQQKENNVWYLDISKLSLTFPFGYDFASAFNEEFITCFKWIKLQHKTESKNSKPWNDLFIKCNQVRIEIGDDPFEVKLRDNYELLEDEYFESQKRNQVLDAKINQLYKTNLLMSSSKVDELRRQLQEKCSSIYIQRSKKMYQTHSKRTHLLLCELHEVQLVAMSDSLMFGDERVKRIIQDLDPDSPWPPEPAEFSTLWCRQVRFDLKSWRVQLRDFPQPLMDSTTIHFWGKLAAAEAAPTKRSLRTCRIEIGGPYESDSVERSLNSLKWYYELSCEIDSLSMAFGPCWEPVLAQCNLAFDHIFPQSKDPSRPLPFWDKIRLLFHGRLYTSINTLTHLLHASLNPYNTTEEMEVTWTSVAIAWTNAKVLFDGDLNIYVRTASKYDDCRMVYLPNIRLMFKLSWVCLFDGNDHHGVQYCGPDKLPEYSSNQEHDSFRSFRSQHLNITISLETKAKAQDTTPSAILYGSTLRWFENLKLILSGTTRPTRRGVLFKNTRLKKVPISRHYKKIRLSVSLNRFHVCYWVSFSMQKGIEINCGKLSSCSEHLMSLQPISDGLVHRSKAEWSVLYVNTEINEIEMWLQTTQILDSPIPLKKPIEKFFFMSIYKLSYGRESLSGTNENGDGNKTEIPQHRLVVHELKGAWTKKNRDVAFSLFDFFVKSQQLRKNLSTEALKSFFSKHDAPTGSPLKKSGENNGDSKKGRQGEVVLPTESSQVKGRVGSVGTSPLSCFVGQNAAASSLLQKLILEAESRGVVFSEDLTPPPPQQSLHGLAQSSLDDVIHQKWLIELVNCQVLLKGTETAGYVIVSAAKAHILQRDHKPVWKHGTIVPKTTWVGSLEGMQYYATVTVGANENTPNENIQWVSVDNIEERDISSISNVPEMVGSGQSVGGVVSETVGESSDESNASVQLQRIISRCKCEFFYTSYGETGVDKIPSGIPDIPPAPSDLQFWDETNKPVEAFTLMHYDLNIFTNSLQYTMIMDIVNNLVLYVDPKRKEAFEKLQRLRFKLQLQSTEAQRRPIQQLQNHLRSLVNQQRRLEKDAYLLQKSQIDEVNIELLQTQRSQLEHQVNECKEQVTAKGEELHMMIMCYKEAKLAATQRLTRKRENKDVSLVRVYEICFKHAQWRLTQTDGQLGIADLILTNFLYTKTAKSDDSVEHLSELGYISVTNLLPNQVYKDVLVPSSIHPSMPVDCQRTLRVFCRDRPPVGGIAVKEHFEINIAPITIGMTYQFFKTLFKFCFPEKDPEKLDDIELISGGEGEMMVSGTSSSTFNTLDSNSTPSSSQSLRKKRGKKKESKFYIGMSEKDDVEKMKERADKNMLFICVKIPEVPVRVSYKGEKEKNIEDVHDVHLIIPTLEYNNITWTWLDFLVAVRNHSKRVLLSQAIKQKLQIWPKVWSDSTTGPQEEDKAKMLLGLSGEIKKKSLFGSKK